MTHSVTWGHDITVELWSLGVEFTIENEEIDDDVHLMLLSVYPVYPMLHTVLYMGQG